MSAAENIVTSNNAPAVQFGSNGDAIAPTPSMPTGGFYDSFNQQQADASMLADLADQGVSLTPKPKANDGDGIIDVKMTAPVSTAEAAAGQLSPLGVMARDAAAPKPLSPLGVMARDAAAPRGENAAAMTNTQSAAAPTPIVPEKNVVNAKAENATTEKNKYAAEKTSSAPTKYFTGEWSSEDADKSKNTSKKTEKKSQNSAPKSETKPKIEPKVKQEKNYSDFKPDPLPENAEKKEDTPKKSLAEVMKGAEVPSPEANAPAPAENKPVESEAERKARIEAEAAAKREADAQWRRERAEEEKGMTAEQKIENRMKAQQRGHKVFDAQGNINMLVSEKISDKQAEKEAFSATYRAIRERDDAIKAKRAEKAKAKAENSRMAQFFKRHKIIGGGVSIAKAIPVGMVDKTVGVVKRSFAIKDYQKTAAEAIKATGNLSAAQMAIDELNSAISGKEKFKNKRERRENIIEKVKDAQKGISLDLFNATNPEDIDKASGLIDPDKAVIERAEQAVRAGNSILRDKGIEFVDADTERQDKLVKGLKEYANLVSSWDFEKTELTKEEKDSRDAAREKIINTINEATDGSISNAAEIVRLIEDNLGGVFKDEIKMNMSETERAKLSEADQAKHNEAVKAIDNYIDKHFNLQGFRVKDSGLALGEEQIANRLDKLTAKSNVIIGISVGLTASFVEGILKNTAIQRITNSQLVMAGAKVLLAGTIGGVRGYRKAKTQQLKSNIDAALGIKPEKLKDYSDVEEAAEKFGVWSDKIDVKSGLDTINSEPKKNAKKSNMNSLMLNVREITDALNSGELSNEDAIKMMGEVLARLDFQEAKRDKKGRGQVNLFEYEGKDKIERGKAELFDAMNNAAERLRAAGVDVEAEFGKAKRMQYQKLERDYNASMKAELKERRRAARNSALIAAGAAAIATVVWDEIKTGGNGNIRQEFMDVINKKKKFSGLNVVDVASDEAAMASVVNGQKTGQQLQEQMQQNRGPINQEHGKNLAGQKGEQIKLSEKGQVYIEDDPDGGQYLGVDKDGDGTIDEYLFGGKTGDGTKGINLNNESDLGLANSTLREKYGVELIRDPSVGEKIAPMKVAAYIDSQPNAMKGMNINDVNWNKSQQLCSIEREIKVFPNDGAELYEVPIDGKVPAGAKLYIDLDGDGPGAPLEYTIENGRALVPASVLDVQTGGTAKFIGTVRVASVENGQFISYTTNIGKKTLSAEDMLNARVEETGSVISVQDATNGTVINQAALDGEGHMVSNLSETFNGRPVAGSTVSRVPYMLHEKTPAAGTTIDVAKLENGAEIPNWEYKGGYKSNFDSSLNYMFKGKDSYVGTPMTLDVNGDGVIDATESAAYIKQMFVGTATNPHVLAENASAYGLLEPSTMNELGFTPEVLSRLGITDGKIDTMEELNIFIEELKKADNADLYDRLVNATLSRMRTDLTGAQFEVVELGARDATYLNNNKALDFIGASRVRTATAPFRIVNGEKVYIGNKGIFGDGKKPVYDILACRQKGIKKPPVTTPPKEPELPPPVEETPPVTTPPKEPELPPPVEDTPPTPTPTPEPTPTPTPTPEPTPEPEPTPPVTLPPKTDPLPMKPRPGDGELPTPEPGTPIGPVTERPIIGNGEATGVDIHEVTGTSASSGSGTGGGQTLDEARESYRRIMGLDDDEEIAA